MEGKKRKGVTLLNFFEKKPKTNVSSEETPSLSSPSSSSSAAVHISSPLNSSSGVIKADQQVGCVLTDVSTLSTPSTSFHPCNADVINEDNLLEERDPSSGCEKARTFIFIGLGPYQPNLKEYPIKKGRKFRPEWYKEYNWLEYSVVSDSAYCYYCRAFCDNVSKGEDAFTKTGYNNWKKAVEKFKSHQNSNAHKLCSVKATEFRNSQKYGSIGSKLDTHRSQVVKENRQYFEAVITSILFCARQGIALRGHREDEASENKGNLLELLSLRSQDNDVISRYYLRKEKTFRYLNPIYQNHFLELMSKNVLNQIINSVKTAGIYSVIMDETQDLKRHEQVSIVLRYCDNSLNIHESFLGLYRTENTDGESLYRLLKSVLISFGLKVEDLRGQCYDGAAAMRGQYSGVAKRIRDENNLAMYVHCYAHVLNLCLVDVSSAVIAVRNMFGVLNKLHTFIEASSKRHSVFENIQKNQENLASRSRSTTIKSLSDTRWNCRLEAINSVLVNISAIIETLEEISNNDKVSGSDAFSILKCVNDFSFLFCLKLMSVILEYTNMLSQHFQKKCANYSTVSLLTKSIVAALQDLRNDNKFNELWKETEKLAEEEGCAMAVVPRKKEVPGKLGGGHRTGNYQSASDFYRQNVYFPVLDTLINDITYRFQENDLKVLHSLRSVLSKNEVEEDDVNLVCGTYKVSEKELYSELNVFSRMCANKNIEDEFDQRLKVFVEQNLSECFPNLNNMFKTFLTVPVSSASSERSFSCLRRLKTYLRNTTGQERLHHLSVLFIERSYDIDIPKIIDKFDSEATLRGRRLQLH